MTGPPGHVKENAGGSTAGHRGLSGTGLPAAWGSWDSVRDGGKRSHKSERERRAIPPSLRLQASVEFLPRQHLNCRDRAGAESPHGQVCTERDTSSRRRGLEGRREILIMTVCAFPGPHFWFFPGSGLILGVNAPIRGSCGCGPSRRRAAFLNNPLSDYGTSPGCRAGQGE